MILIRMMQNKEACINVQMWNVKMCKYEIIAPGFNRQCMFSFCKNFSSNAKKYLRWNLNFKSSALLPEFIKFIVQICNPVFCKRFVLTKIKTSY